jgi:hypothetical protein
MKSKLSGTRGILGHGRLGLTILAAVWMANASPAWADLIGTSVSGVLQFPSQNQNNFFDLANGFVPSGFGNSAPHGPNNVIIGSEIEFGFRGTLEPSDGRHPGAEFGRGRLATRRPGADREEVDAGALCSAENPAQRPKGEARAREVGRSCGARARGRDGTATCGAVNEALSYRVAEAPFG